MVNFTYVFRKYNVSRKMFKTSQFICMAATCIIHKSNYFINEDKYPYPLRPENHLAPLPSENISVYTVF